MMMSSDGGMIFFMVLKVFRGLCKAVASTGIVGDVALELHVDKQCHELVHGGVECYGKVVDPCFAVCGEVVYYLLLFFSINVEKLFLDSG